MEGVFFSWEKVLLQRALLYLFHFLFLLNLPTQTESKESKWDMPDELLLLEKVKGGTAVRVSTGHMESSGVRNPFF